MDHVTGQVLAIGVLDQGKGICQDKSQAVFKVAFPEGTFRVWAFHQGLNVQGQWYYGQSSSPSQVLLVEEKK